MNKIASLRGPLGLKAERPSRQEIMAGKLHMAKVAQLACVICGRWPVEAHHVFHGRYGSRRASDFEVIPLCVQHHREGPDAVHNDKAGWAERYGNDYDYLPTVADALAGELNGG